MQRAAALRFAIQTQTVSQRCIFVLVIATFTLPWTLHYELRLFGYASCLPRKRPYGKHAEPGPTGIDQLVSEVPPPYQTSLLYSVQTGLPSFLAGPVVK